MDTCRQVRGVPSCVYAVERPLLRAKHEQFPASQVVPNRSALDRVSQRVIAERLCVLDNTIGLSVSQLVLTRFRLQRSGVESEVQDPVVEDPQAFLPAPAPLTLAAHGSMGTGEMLDLDVQADQTSYINEAPQSEEPSVPWTPGNQGPGD